MAIVSVSTVNAGHTHTTTVPAADIGSTTDRTYTSTATDHAHMVTLTAANFATIDGGGSVTVTSTNSGGHTHDFTFSR